MTSTAYPKMLARMSEAQIWQEWVYLIT